MLWYKKCMFHICIKSSRVSSCRIMYWTHNSSTRLASSLLRDALTDSGIAPVPYRHAAFQFSVLIAVTGTRSASVISKPELTRRCRCILFVPKQPGWHDWRLPPPPRLMVILSTGRPSHTAVPQSLVAMPSYQDECARTRWLLHPSASSLRAERAEGCCGL